MSFSESVIFDWISSYNFEYSLISLPHDFLMIRHLPTSKSYRSSSCRADSSDAALSRKEINDHNQNKQKTLPILDAPRSEVSVEVDALGETVF